ncbi:hypothetical protein [Aliiglaciecola lipolytica]|uniref:Uncharacterized protein n=1 Tax=Aliiglaciecola lipolytica E3 TaxID=1127673 RepID=K6YHC9_9ALTE|nr:hypothetical protein [Aliiglaciecola lipolytica]GAC16028.1 hypothetical protein GLIP_3414 [Aliiglaciecola lipolytica E3]
MVSNNTEKHPSANPINFTTISPIDIPFSLIRGFNRKSENFKNLMSSLSQRDDIESVNWFNDGPEYVNLDSDVSSLSFFVWSNQYQEIDLKFHIFPNELAVVECQFTLPEQDSIKIMESRVQQLAEEAIRQSIPELQVVLKDIYSHISNPLLIKPRTNSTHLYWTARSLNIEKQQLKNPQIRQLIHQWLAETECPKDAEKICNLINEDILSDDEKADKLKTESMTWLNYVVVDKRANHDARIDTMVLAQYCYTAQEKCNLRLHEAISRAYIDGNLLGAKSQLEDSRIQSKLHQVAINEHKKYLTRQKRKYLEEIFASWEFDLLIKNGDDMKEICTNKIEEANAKQSKLHSIKTDRILFAISLFAIFELLIFLSQHSREVMSRPALDYNDESSSWILTLIASLDADTMFGIGIGLMIVLAFIYTSVAKRKL